MKAIVTTRYGSAEVLELQEVNKPVIKDDEILIQVYAFSVNPVDCKVRKGDMKIITGRKPPRVLGADYAGVVSEIGEQITNYKVGDAIFGIVNAFKGGTYAEFVKVKEQGICLKPENLSFEEAASLPVVALTAYQSLIHEGQLKQGDHVMINGCSGGVGITGVQIAKTLGCYVTGVCSAKNAELVKKMGVDKVIDYNKENILKEKETYDIFFDAVANKSFFNVKKTLKPNGIYVTTLPTFQAMVLAPFINVISPKKFKKIMVDSSTKSSKDLIVLKEMADSGKLVPVIDKIYPIEKIQEAQISSETGRVVGKIVVKGFSQ